MIPKRIIQIGCWPGVAGPEDLPLILRSAVVNVKLLHPTFEYLFFTEAKVQSFVEENFPEYKNEFYSFRFPIQRYDFFRYLALYRLGGFYLDLDIFLAKDLNPLLDSESVFAFEELTGTSYFKRHFGMDWQIANYAFGSAPGHPFMAAVIENCLRAKNDPAWVVPMMKGIPGPFRDQFYIINTTGPGLVSRTFAENPRYADSLNILFPDDVRDPGTWHQFGSFGVHQMIGAWRKRPTFLSFPVQRLWDAWSLRRVLAAAKLTGKTRHHGGREVAINPTPEVQLQNQS